MVLYNVCTFLFPPAVDEAGVLVCGTVSRDSPV